MGSIYQYLSEATPDYSSTVLEVNPQQVVVESFEIKSNIMIADDGVSEERISLSSISPIDIQLIFEAISPEEAESIMDFYLDPLKGQGNSRTFIWKHIQQDGSHQYVVRFSGEGIKRSYNEHLYQTITGVNFRVLGRIEEES